MKLKITYDNAKDKFYFDYDDGTLKTFYGLYAAIEELQVQAKKSYPSCEELLTDLAVSNTKIIELEVKQ